MGLPSNRTVPYTIDNVCVPTGLETPVKLFSYPSYGAPNIGKFVEWLFGFLLHV